MRAARDIALFMVVGCGWSRMSHSAAEWAQPKFWGSKRSHHMSDPCLLASQHS